MFAAAKSIKNPKTIPKTQPTKVTVNSSVIKYPADKTIWAPSCFNQAKISRSLCHHQENNERSKHCSNHKNQDANKQV